MPSVAQHLKDLEWLVGDWAEEPSEQSDISLRSTCGWTENRAFLIRKFKVERKGDVLHAGTEVIGWDPRGRRLRSWVFDSDGGFGENTWIHDGDHWLLKYSGVLSDGSEVSATNIITMVDADRVTLQSRDRVANGQQQPEIPSIAIRRRPVTHETTAPKATEKPAEHVLP
jgi:hypothetical protein